jgi:DNA polymerase-1
MIYLITGQQKLLNVETDVYINTNIEHCLNYFKNHLEIQFDTETTGFDPYTCDLLTIQLGDKENQFVIDSQTVHISIFKELLESKLLLMHNAKFDLRFLRKYDILPNKIYDTFLAECILTTGHEERELGLDSVVLRYTDGKLDKSIRGDIHREGLSNRVIQYCAYDVKYLSDIKSKQLEKIEQYELQNVLDLENEVVKVFAKIEYDGIKIDSEKWLEVADKVNEDLNLCFNQLDDMVINEPKLKEFVPKTIQGNLFGFEERLLKINWSSNQQKLLILKTLGLKITSVGDRELQRNKRFHQLIPKLIEYTKLAKLSTAFGKEFLKFVNKKTGRIHYNIWQILSTGRISVSEPNLNQIPSKGDLAKVIRSCFIPREGYKIVGGDFSGMELRIIAEFSQDPLWVNSFIDGNDLHSVLCAATFDIPITDVKKETPFKPGVTYRDVQKTINFGLAYGMSKFKLADTMQIEVSKADEIIKKFFKVVPKVESFLNTLGNLGKKRGYIRTALPFRRIRWFQNWDEARNPHNPKGFAIMGEIERASKNTPKMYGRIKLIT